MDLTSYIQDKQLTIALSGEIDHHRARRVMEAVTKKIDEYLPRVCILDYRDVTFMDSSGIAVVICAVRRMRELEKVLRAAGVEKIAEMEGSVPV